MVQKPSNIGDMVVAHLRHFRTPLGGQWMPPALVKAANIQWGYIHYVLNVPSRISIQWALIVKYAFIHIECYGSHVKVSFISFQLLSLLNLLINSTNKLDICESI